MAWQVSKLIWLICRWPVVTHWWTHEAPDIFPDRWWKAVGLVTFQARLFWSAPLWLSAVTWDMLATLNSGLGLGALLVRQLQFVFSGQGYIDRMQHRRDMSKRHDVPHSRMRELRGAFAFEPVIFWLRPAWRYPLLKPKRMA